MPDIKFATADVAAMKLGTANVSKVMLGTVEIWPGAPISPPCPVTDDFQRADGPLGSNWVATAVPAWNDTQTLMTIVSGAAVGPTQDTVLASPWLGNSARWHAPVALSVIEAEIEFNEAEGFYVYLFTNANTTNAACWMGHLSYRADAVVDPYFCQIIGFPPGDTSGAYGDYGDPVTNPPVSSPCRVRFESDPTEHRLYLNDVFMYAYTPGPTETITGSYVGIGTDWGHGAQGGELTASPRFLSVTIGCLGGCAVFTDDFERADGAIGANWVLGPSTAPTGQTTVLPTISSGALAGPVSGGGAHPRATTINTMLAAGATQYVEAVVANGFSSPAELAYGWSVELFTHVDMSIGFPGQQPKRRLLIQGGDWTGGPRLKMDVMSDAYDGYTTDGDGAQFLPFTNTGPLTFRFETYADGRMVAYLNGAVVVDYTETERPAASFVGRQQGVFIDSASVLRILSVTGGCLPPVIPPTTPFPAVTLFPANSLYPGG